MCFLGNAAGVYDPGSVYQFLVFEPIFQDICASKIRPKNQSICVELSLISATKPLTQLF